MDKFKYLLLFLVCLSTTCLSGSENTQTNPEIIPVRTTKPEKGKIYPIAIIGAGAGGTMAAKRASLNNCEALLFTGAEREKRHSRGNWVKKVDNVPGLEKYNRTILELRNESLTDIIHSPLGHNLFIIEDSVISIEKEGKIFKMSDNAGNTYLAQFVVLATGIMDEQPHIQGSIRPISPYANKQDAVYCPLCDGHRSLQKNTVVIGHTNRAASTAISLANQYNPLKITLLTNGKDPKLNKKNLKLLKASNIQIEKEPISEILGYEEQNQLTNFRLESGKSIPADIAFVTLGIRPNNTLALQLKAKVDRTGLVVTNKYGESSIPNLFVIGDLRSKSMKQIYTAWQHAVTTVQIIGQKIQSKQLFSLIASKNKNHSTGNIKSCSACFS